MTDTDRLFDEYVRAWHAGQSPDAASFLDRAVDEPAREDLARLISDFVAAAPSVLPTPERAAELRGETAVARALALGDAFDGVAALDEEPWPVRLRAARERAGLTRGQLGARFAEAFGLGGREERAETLLGRLEDGELPATGVSGRAAAGLERLLGAATGALTPPRVQPLYRADPQAAGDFGDVLRAAAGALGRRSADPTDELDELLRGGGD